VGKGDNHPQELLRGYSLVDFLLFAIKRQSLNIKINTSKPIPTSDKATLPQSLDV
jgi:hypothetical protein